MMRHHLRLDTSSLQVRLVALVAAAVLSAMPAAAQPKDPPRPGWTLRPSLTFSGAWDDNVMLVGLDERASVDEGTPGDYVTALVPAGSLDYLGQRLQLMTGYQGSFVVYRDLTQLNSLDQHAHATLQYRTTPRTTVVLGQSISTAQTTDAVELVGVPFRRVGNWTSATQAGLEGRLTSRMTARAGYAFRVVDFDDNAEDFISFPGGHEHHFSGALDQRFSPRLTLGGSYDVRRVEVTDSLEIVLVQHSTATAEYRVSEPVTLSGNIGISHLGAGATHPARTGLAWRAGISARLRGADVSGHYQRSVVPSFGFGGTFQNEELVGGLRMPFARTRGYWQTSLAWRDNDPLIIGPPSTRTVWFSSLVGYAVWPWLRAEGYYTRADQNTQRPGGQIHRDRIGFQIVTSKPVKLAR